MKKNIIAISGLQRMDNPQPGAGMIQSLRRACPDLTIIGLVYDAMESGIYAAGGPDQVHLMPYPTAGTGPYFERLDAIRAHTPFEILIPTLDSEIELLSHVSDLFKRRGIRVCLPDPATLRRRSKSHLPELAETCDVDVPDTRMASDLGTASRMAAELGFPLIVKGPYYEARVVRNGMELSTAANRLLSEWGAPVILQSPVCGPEFNVLGLGDGQGRIRGMCAIRKTVLSEKGKGLGGITVHDPVLNSLCTRLIRALRWPGPFEIELIFNEADHRYTLIEINPRFPAWIDFPSQLGANFPLALLRMIRGERLSPLPATKPGHFYIRHQVEAVGHISRFSALMGDNLPAELLPWGEITPPLSRKGILP
ncbi:MAG: hypothetical protein SFY92_05725 [Verrucomicrobiae bacterium]|nr:hypothetical protein [Verrucomicrobiae bacterium]